jgi:adenylate cyclase class 2
VADATPSVETEIKLHFPNASSARRALRKAGFRVVTRRGLEVNVLYDTPAGTLRAQGLAVRHRTWHRQHIVTYKGPPERTPGGRHKYRIEKETVVADISPVVATWEAAGLMPSFRYEKYRTVLRRAGERGHAMLDETPIGTYVELEGAPSWIDRTARLMGFSPSDYIQSTYVAMHAQGCASRGIPFCDLKFASQAKFT